jgi:hypothetical protein
MSRRVRRALLVAAGCIAAAAAGAVLFESALRWRDPLRDDGFPPGLFVAEATRGYALAPGAQVDVQRIRPFRIEVNEAGYRDRSWSDEARPRLLIVGSSALFGFGVEGEARLSERLEHHLGLAYRVLNAGVYGYGPPQARATIEKECAAQKPVLVLYVHEYKLTRRDFLGVPGRTVRGGQLVNRVDSAPVAPSPVAATASEAAGYLGLPRTRAWLWRHGLHPRQVAEKLKGDLHPAYLARYVLTADATVFPNDGPELAAAHIVEMKSAAEACGAGFAAVVLPGPYEHRYGEEPATARVLAALSGSVAVVDLRRELGDRPVLVLEGLDYFDAWALDGFGAAIARELRARSLLLKPA